MKTKENNIWWRVENKIWWGVLVIILFISIVGLFIYTNIPHKVCHYEEETIKMEVGHIKTYMGKTFNFYDVQDLPENTIEVLCEEGVSLNFYQNLIFSEDWGYVTNWGEKKICLVKTRTKVCEIR